MNATTRAAGVGGVADEVESLAVSVRPLLDADRREAARLYLGGLLEEEVRPMMPRHLERAEAVLAELITPGSSAWVAECGGGELAGVALCQEPRGGPPSMVNWRALRRHLPVGAAARAWIVSRYLYRVRLASDETYLQSLVVAERWRDRGVGGALLRFVCDEAQQRGYRRVTLNVVDRNAGARRLYLRLGFIRVRTTPTGLFKYVVGFGAMDLMEWTPPAGPHQIRSDSHSASKQSRT